mmetsp:Transcript_48438/g.110369  ORF Transcript_48438/g.110369 Transcript_48438/m.110369 type:complete len:99 (+) Transcript_48438:2-298(+)
MGPVGALLQIYSGPIAVSDDQQYATRHMLNNTDKVTLDYSGRLVLNLGDARSQHLLTIEDGIVRSKVTGAAQCFVHGNGPGKDAWRELLRALHGYHSR